MFIDVSTITTFYVCWLLVIHFLAHRKYSILTVQYLYLFLKKDVSLRIPLYGTLKLIIIIIRPQIVLNVCFLLYSNKILVFGGQFTWKLVNWLKSVFNEFEVGKWLKWNRKIKRKKNKSVPKLIPIQLCKCLP